MSLEQVAAYCDQAKAQGVVEIALTEHLFRFVQADRLVGRFWERAEVPGALQASMAAYWEHHARADLDVYVETALAAKAAGLPVVVGLEVDYYRGQMERVSELLAGYPFDVLLGSVHWIGAWRFDDLDDEPSMAEWSSRGIDACWDAYAEALEELAQSATCDVLAHPDLIKVVGHRPQAPSDWWDRIAEAAARSGMAAELSSAGWRKPVREQYPSVPLLERLVASGVPLTTASDAHELGQVADRCADMRSILEDLGVHRLQAYRGRAPHPVDLAPVSTG
jgi:histidinol-phosphatase (PHP family)